MNVTISDLLDLSHTLAGDYLRQFQYPWEALDGIKDLILSLGSQLSPEEYSQPQEHVWVHKTAVVGNSVELKNVILFDNVQVPHYNYVGDSILGYKSHMGAGSITSNVKSDKTLVVVKGDTAIPTGRKKMGAILGDFVEVGCNSVLNPGTILGRHSSVYPTSCVRGVIPAHSIYKDKDHIVLREEQ